VGKGLVVAILSGVSECTKTITVAIADTLIAAVRFFNYDAYTTSLNVTTFTVTPNPSTIVLGVPITFHVSC